MRTLTISGNLGHDPELKTFDNGSQVAQFSMAVRQNRPDKDGNYGTDWIRCSVFGKRAEVINRYYHKGSHVVVSGDLMINEWTNKDGKAQKSVEVNVNDFDLPDNRRQSNDSEELDITDDDLPF